MRRGDLIGDDLAIFLQLRAHVLLGLNDRLRYDLILKGFLLASALGPLALLIIDAEISSCLPALLHVIADLLQLFQSFLVDIASQVLLRY